MFLYNMNEKPLVSTRSPRGIWLLQKVVFMGSFFLHPQPNGPFTRPKRRRAGGTLLKTSQILWILPALDRCLWKICRSTTGAGLYDLPYRLSSASSVNLLKLLKVGTIHWFWNAKRSSGDRLPVPICLSLIFVIVCFIHGHILNQLIWLICHIYIYHSLLTRPDFVYHWLGVGSSVACS